jgi:peptide deformylase
MSNLPYEIICCIANHCKLEDVMSLNKIWNLDHIVKRKEQKEQEYVYKTVYDTLSKNDCITLCLLYPIHNNFCYKRVTNRDKDTNVTFWINPKYVDVVYKAINDLCLTINIDNRINT